MAENQVLKELEKKFYDCFEKERMFMKNDLQKILESFELAKNSENVEKLDIEKLKIEKEKAIDSLDIEKIKTLNEKIDNIEKEQLCGNK
ncbi:MAG: hypothetical protein ACI4TI_03975 [Christensenellales bacterium]